MLTKIYAKITIIVVENREPYYFVTICKCKQSLFLFSYQILALILTMDERSSYKVHRKFRKILGVILKIFRKCFLKILVKLGKILKMLAGSLFSRNIERQTGFFNIVIIEELPSPSAIIS